MSATATAARACIDCRRGDAEGAPFGARPGPDGWRCGHCARTRERAQEQARRAALRAARAEPIETPRGGTPGLTPLRLVRQRLGPCPPLEEDRAGAKAYYAALGRACAALAGVCGDPVVAAAYAQQGRDWACLSGRGVQGGGGE